MSEYDNNFENNNETNSQNANQTPNEEIKNDAYQENFGQPQETASQSEPEQVVADKVYEPQSGQGAYSYTYDTPNNAYGRNDYNHQSFTQNGQPQYSYNNPQPAQQNVNAKRNKGIVVICCILAAVVLLTGGIFATHSFIGSSSNTTQENNYSSSLSDKEINGVDGGSVVMNAKAEKDALTTTEIAKIAKKSSVGVLVYSTKTNSISFGQNISGNDSNKTGEGTGVIIELDKQGDYTYIVTCAHVISDGNISVKILLEDGTTYDAEIVGVDEQTDIGLLRVNEKSLQKNAATIGTSSNLQVGQSVFAMGNPGGADFFGSFTGGVVSAIGRSLSSSTGYTMECIQHDAAINPGNSGGGLFNAQGQLIGINSSKIASTEYEGMSFAIPIDEAVNVVNSLSTFGYVPNRPKLGINYALARTYNQAYQMIVSFKGLPSGTLLIAKISSESSLTKLGVKEGDMIVSANGKKLDTADVLLDIIENGKVGDVIELGICRIENNNSNYNVKEFTVKATLVEDKGSKSSDEEQTTQSYEDYFNYFFGNGGN